MVSSALTGSLRIIVTLSSEKVFLGAVAADCGWGGANLNSMNLIEVFLPLDKGSGAPVNAERIEAIVKELADRFGGATAFTREPADGLWKRSAVVERDRIVIVEVMVSEVDGAWWHSLRRRLEEEFEQQEILIRVTACRQI